MDSHWTTVAEIVEVPDEMYSLMNKIAPFLGLYSIKGGIDKI